MEPRSTQEVVSGWWLYQRLLSGTRPERKALSMGEPIAAVAASDAMFHRMQAGGVAAVHLILALLEGSPDADGYVAVGTGPLEDLVSLHGNELAAELAEAARRDPRFGAALGVISDQPLSANARRVLAPWLRGR